MQTSTMVIAILVPSAFAYRLGPRRSLALVGGPRSIRDLHSLPSYYGFLTAIWCALPALLVLAAWHMLDRRLILDTVLSHMPGELQRRRAEVLFRFGHPAAGAGLLVGEQPGTHLHRANLGRDHRVSGLPAGHECGRRGAAQPFRAALVAPR